MSDENRKHDRDFNAYDQVPDLVSKLPSISAYTLFVRVYCSFLKWRKKGEDCLELIMPILWPGEKVALFYPSLALWKGLK